MSARRTSGFDSARLEAQQARADFKVMLNGVRRRATALSPAHVRGLESMMKAVNAEEFDMVIA
jgi:hypothetical protein